MATTSKSTGFAGLRCPLCGDPSDIKVEVHELTVSCGSCGEDIDRETIEAQARHWRNLLRWVDSAEQFAEAV